MRELLAIIPYLDVLIVVLLAFFIYLGWNHGVPRLAMVIGSIYTGFLLATIYYHLFAGVLSNAFRLSSGFVTDLVSFLVLDVLITILMLALLFSLYGRVEVKGRAAVFDKMAGSLLGLFAGALVVGILLMVLRLPYEANKQKLNPVADMPAMQIFNQQYEKSALSSYFMKATPALVLSVKPMLPPQTQQKGAVPLLQAILAQ